MRPFDALLLDSDGTLVDSQRVTEVAWRAWARRHGLDEDAVAKACHGVPAAQTVRAWAPHLDPVAEAAQVERDELALDDVRAYPGAADLLALLGPDRVAVVTSAPPELLAARFAAAGLTLPALVVTARDVEHGKPDPAPYLAGAARVGVEPSACLVVEDAPAGIVAGAAADCQVAAVAQTHAADELAAADTVFAEVPTLLAACRATLAAAGFRPRGAG